LYFTARAHLDNEERAARQHFVTASGQTVHIFDNNRINSRNQVIFIKNESLQIRGLEIYDLQYKYTRSVISVKCN
ncbi:hypothetical protein, partial [Natronogracilivirga saccharolytica]